MKISHFDTFFFLEEMMVLHTLHSCSLLSPQHNGRGRCSEGSRKGTRLGHFSQHLSCGPTRVGGTRLRGTEPAMASPFPPRGTKGRRRELQREGSCCWAGWSRCGSSPSLGFPYRKPLQPDWAFQPRAQLAPCFSHGVFTSARLYSWPLFPCILA